MLNIPSQKRILSEIDGFLKKKKMLATKFGMDYFGDPNFVQDIRNKGRRPKLATIEKINEIISEVHQ